MHFLSNILAVLMVCSPILLLLTFLIILIRARKKREALASQNPKRKSGNMLDVLGGVLITTVIAMVEVSLLENNIIPPSVLLLIIPLTAIFPIAFIIYRVSNRTKKANSQEPDVQEASIDPKLMLMFMGFLLVMITIELQLSRNVLIAAGACLVLLYLYQLHKGSRQTKGTIQLAPKSLSGMVNNSKFTFALIMGIAGLLMGRQLVAPDANIAECNDVNPALADTTIQACTNLINNGNSQPVVFMKRAAAYLNKRLVDQARGDIDRSLSINPDYAPSLALRSSIYLMRGQYIDALHNIDHAISSQKENNKAAFLMLYMRGVANFFAISPALAIDDFENTVRQDTTNSLNDMGILWLHLAKVRSGHDDQQEFEHNTNSLIVGKWPAPLIALYRGKGTVEDVFSKAKTGDVSEQSDQICDANFYTAEFYLLQNKKAEAQPLFQAAKNVCPISEFERGFSQTELKALESNAVVPANDTMPTK